ncbi:MAG: pyridoxamine 5'-phosphate oxidase family protein [Actinomycetota bacterium]|nr:pyridoxamine 5'-phosphate oxidase family protein [Actinomycetota bacterium]
MAAWHELRSAEPELAGAGRELLYPHGAGLAFLATVRSDGGPRLHPMWPLLTEDELFAFIIPSPKQTDLRRDGRYALHSFPTEDNEDTFSVSGRARLEEDPSTRRGLEDQFAREHETLGVPTPDPNDALFSFDIESCVLTRATGRGHFTPAHKVWRP